jgi:putative FmdB family regulatory protein
MPLYEYQCAQCGDVLEVLQKLSDAPLTIHANCGGALKRVVSPSALHFKGSGWYVTDYAKGSKSKASDPKTEVKDAKSDVSKPAAETKPVPAKT